MSVKIIRREEQADGQFNGGAVMEKRPIIYQNKNTFPYSNLFYWAHAWSEKGSTIGLHPHQGFEIMSFVLKGSLEHYDTKNKAWIPLQEGSVQIIRAGNGISHAEKLNAGAHMFQIWFDPNLDQSLRKPASYNDYSSNSFPIEERNGMSIRTLKGENSPVQMSTEGIVIKEYRFEKGQHEIAIGEGNILSAFLLQGKLQVESKTLHEEDFFKAEHEQLLHIEAQETSWIFTIESPLLPSYKTYAEQNL